MNETDSPAQSRTAIASSFFNKLYRYLNVLISKWWVLVLCIGLGVGLHFTLQMYAPPAYESLGRMIVGSKSALPGGGNFSEEMNNFYGTQIALMQSDTVSNRVLLFLQTNNPTLRRSPVNLKVNVTPKTSIFNLRAISPDPAYAQAFLGAVMDRYVELKKEMRSRAATTTESAVKDELTNMQAQVTQSKKALADFETSTNSFTFLQERSASTAAYLTELTKQYADLKSETNLLAMLTLDENVERQLSLAQHSLDNAPQTKEIKQGASEVPVADNGSKPGANSLMTTTSDYLRAKQQIALLEQERKEWSQFLKDKHPKLIAMDEDIARKKQLLEVFKGQSQDQLKNLQHSLELQLANKAQLIREVEAKSLEISKKTTEYQNMKEENLRLQTMYERLLNVSYQLETERSMTQESVTILEEASPSLPVRKQSAKWLAVASALGLMLGLGILLVLDRLDDRPTSLSELQEAINEEVLGQIPLTKTKDKKSPGILREEDDRHALVEAYRNLRSSIMFLGTPENHPRTLLITSAIPADGKSMTSANLAITLARSGGRVLLVDADLRRGVMHTRFGTRNSPGFSEVLSEQCKWTDAVIQTDTPNLTLLPRGSTKRHPGELFVTASKDKFLEAIAGKFDYILFDTAPVMAADDVSNLAPYVDGVVMVIRANHTSGRVARAALDVLYQRKTNLLGVVFNAVRTRSSEYYYYHYKDYYAKNPTE